MYTLYMDGVPIYVPGSDERYSVTSPSLSLELNTSGTLSFTMPPTNAEYDSVRKLRSTVIVYRDGNEYWRGRVISTDRNVWNEKTVTCEGALGYLNDVVIRPFEYRGTIEGYLKLMLGKYNEHVDDERRIELGNITVVDNNDYIYKYRESHTVLLELLQEQLVDSMGGYLSVRADGETLYLDYLAESGPAIDQTIMFGENILDIDESITTDDVYTVIIPKGATITPEGDGTEIEGEDNSYTVDITEVNDGLDYIVSEAGVEMFGWIERVVEWEDVELPENLKAKAEDALENAINAAMSITVSAVDLHWTDDEMDQLDLGVYAVVLSVPHGIHGRFSVSSMTLRLDDPSGGSYTLGATPGTLTGMNTGHSNGTETSSDTLVAYRKKIIKREIPEDTSNVVGYAVVGIAKVG